MVAVAHHPPRARRSRRKPRPSRPRLAPVHRPDAGGRPGGHPRHRRAGATNAALLAAQILAGSRPELRSTPQGPPRGADPRRSRRSTDVSGPILPGATVGVLGSGQLGRMFAIAASRMGYRVHVLSPDTDTPTGQVADVEITAPYDDLEACAPSPHACPSSPSSSRTSPRLRQTPPGSVRPSARPAPSSTSASSVCGRRRFLRNAGLPVPDFFAIRTRGRSPLVPRDPRGQGRPQDGRLRVRRQRTIHGVVPFRGARCLDPGGPAGIHPRGLRRLRARGVRGGGTRAGRCIRPLRRLRERPRAATSSTSPRPRRP